MIVIGLTGSIATGKSTVARMIVRYQVPVFDADKVAHQLMEPGTQAFQDIQEAFPEAINHGVVDRKALGQIVFADANAREKLEAIIHPRVRQAELQFITAARLQRRKAVLLDIPLLYESGADALCDLVLVTYCPLFMQRKRAMQRGGMSEEKFGRILRSQMTQQEKMTLADTVIVTSLGKGFTNRQTYRIMKEIGCA